jgi:amino acid adenylation domain-containing protein
VEGQVRKTPESVAVRFGEESITYLELDSRANRLAQILLGMGVGPDKFVAVHLDRSIELVVTLLAVLKAGGAYVYLDPNYPAKRREFILSDAAPAAIVSRKGLMECLPAALASRTVCVDDKSQPAFKANGRTRHPDVEPGNLAYLIYTSGSTGTPKAVAMPHAVLCNLLEWQMMDWTPPAPARTLQFSSLNFDVSFQEIFSTFYAGGTLILLSEEERLDPFVLLRVMRENAVERIFLPFVGLQQLAAAFEVESVPLEHLRDVITAGEQLQITPQVRAFFASTRSCTLHNQYGPAETHVVTAHALRGDPGKWPLLPPIGSAIPNAMVYILDGEMRPTVNGNVGEIYVGGETLARGYWKREDLTAERFIPDPFSIEPDARLYRTGDLGRRLHAGGIECLGRADQQVKIRGVRVEPGEIEAEVVRHPAVSQAAVCVVGEETGDKRLACFFVQRDGCAVTEEQLRKFLEASLPPQLVPSFFLALAALRLTPSGKIDRRSLVAESAAQFETPVHPGCSCAGGADEIEQKLAAIWEDLLKKSPIHPEDDFFDLGGDSLLAVHVCTKVRKILGRNLSVSALCSAPRFDQLASLLRSEPTRPPTTHAPVFCIPPLMKLAEHLGPEQPFYGLQFPADSVLGGAAMTIEKIAEDCIRQLFAIQDSGPYHIAGFSFGGVVAFEVARQLTEVHNEEVLLLAMLDPDPPKPYETKSTEGQYRRYSFHLRSLAQLSLAGKMRYVARSLRNEAVRLLAPWAAAFGMGAGFQKLFPDDAEVFQVEIFTRLTEPIHARYEAKPYGGAAVLILAGDTPVRHNCEEDPRSDWNRFLTGAVDVFEVPGDHAAVHKEPHVRQVAKMLKSCMSAAAQSAAQPSGTGNRDGFLPARPGTAGRERSLI